MTLQRLLGALACIAAMAPAARSQSLDAARELLTADRNLSPSEIAVVLVGVRAAIAGKACRLSYAPGGPGPELLMGADGRPRLVRAGSGHSGQIDLVTLTEYTGRPALRCDGTPLDRELVIEYERKSGDDRWSARARMREAFEPTAPAFDVLAGNAVVESGPRRAFDTRVGRALVAPWNLPAGALSGGPLPAGARQSLWIDAASLLPLQWSIALPQTPDRPPLPDYVLLFDCSLSVELRRPDTPRAPDCVP